ncbi:MAG: GNAT family N-acetyltransferase [Filomicrobium sp.]
MRADKSDAVADKLLHERISTTNFGPNALRLSLITTRSAFNELEAEWNALFQKAGKPGNPFQSFNWCWHWANSFLKNEPNDTFFIISGRRNGRLIMIWPLVRQRTAGLTQLTWIGRPVTQYGDVLIDSCNPINDLRAGWRFLKAHAKADVIELCKVRGDASITPLLSEIGAITTHRDAAPYADMSQHETFSDYAKARYSAKRRTSLRRNLRRCQVDGELETDFIKEGADARHATKQLLAMKMAWLKEKSLISQALQDQRTHQFFLDAVSDPTRPTGCELTLLRSGNELLAADLKFTAKNQSVAHVITYNLKFEKLSPGNLMTMLNLEHFKQHGTQVFDFMGPDSSFKREWSDGVIGVNDWAVPLSLKGRLWSQVYLAFARDHLKKLFSHLPKSLKKTLSGSYVLAIGMF